ncbi:MAG: hypothetical protein AUH32_07720 [Actinobacteria bacterium 13_1_40CM_66_12]|nr:MAG: hypothetical protein AUH32_07720 [Actinobacteria bacterium 13_1_40CM_66_12]
MKNRVTASGRPCWYMKPLMISAAAAIANGMKTPAMRLWMPPPTTTGATAPIATSPPATQNANLTR